MYQDGRVPRGPGEFPLLGACCFSPFLPTHLKPGSWKPVNECTVWDHPDPPNAYTKQLEPVDKEILQECEAIMIVRIM